MGARRQSREIALQVLYAVDVCKINKEEAWDNFIRKYQGNIENKITDFSKIIVDGVVENKKQIDEQIEKYAKNWAISRMAAVDRTILRMASYELMELFDIPINVIINEAVEIAKAYSTNDSGKFVNGILDKIKQVRE
ncbi:transcription antitermination factor NusB [bacterium]